MGAEESVVDLDGCNLSLSHDETSYAATREKVGRGSVVEIRGLYVVVVRGKRRSREKCLLNGFQIQVARCGVDRCQMTGSCGRGVVSVLARNPSYDRESALSYPVISEPRGAYEMVKVA